MADKDIGMRNVYVYGTVVNRKDDPTQTGRCRVRWEIGGINQSDLKDDELPWSPSLMSRHSPSKDHKGGPHTGYIEGTRVVGWVGPDGQDVTIHGSVVSAGSGDPDGKPEYKSDIPVPAQEEKVGEGESQPKYGDKNGVVEDYKDKSVVTYAEEQGGPEKKPAKSKDLPDSIGLYGGSSENSTNTPIEGDESDGLNTSNSGSGNESEGLNTNNPTTGGLTS